MKKQGGCDGAGTGHNILLVFGETLPVPPAFPLPLCFTLAEQRQHFEKR